MICPKNLSPYIIITNMNNQMFEPTYLTVGSGAEADQGDSLERRNRTERSRCLSGQALVGSLAHSEIVYGRHSFFYFLEC